MTLSSGPVLGEICSVMKRCSRTALKHCAGGCFSVCSLPMVGCWRLDLYAVLLHWSCSCMWNLTFLEKADFYLFSFLFSFFFPFQKRVRNAAFGNFFGVMALFQSGRLVKVTLLSGVTVLGILMWKEDWEKSWVTGKLMQQHLKLKFSLFLPFMDSLWIFNVCSWVECRNCVK